MRSVYLISFLIVSAFAFAKLADAATYNGTVRSVTGDVATVSMTGDVMPPNGTKAEFFFKIAGVDEEISVGTGSLLRIDHGDLLVKIENATGTIESGQSVRFVFSPSPGSSPPSAKSESSPPETPPPTSSATPREATRYANEAYDKFEAKDWKGALPLYNKIIELEPTNAMAYSNRASIYYSLKQSERGLVDANEAIRLDPQNAIAYITRGNCYIGTNKLKRAIEDFDEAIRLNPGIAQAYYNRGTAYARLSQYKTAIEDYTQAIVLNPQHEDAFFNRAQCYKLTGKTQLAKRDLARVRELAAAAKSTEKPPKPKE